MHSLRDAIRAAGVTAPDAADRLTLAQAVARRCDVVARLAELGAQLGTRELRDAQGHRTPAHFRDRRRSELLAEQASLQGEAARLKVRIHAESQTAHARQGGRGADVARELLAIVESLTKRGAWLTTEERAAIDEAFAWLASVPP